MKLFLVPVICILPMLSASQSRETPVNAGSFSLGVRNTLSGFNHDGWGLGTGGQFRIGLSETLNTDWFADYISIKTSDQVRSEYYHIGWSVLFYFLKGERSVKPFILAGHCFDYNKKTLIDDPSISRGRWGSAVQAGGGIHIFMSKDCDITFVTQYMMHLTSSIESHVVDNRLVLHAHNSATLEGHLLATISINYKLFDLWKKK